MLEVNEWLWESVYVMKQLYDHDHDAPILRCYGDTVMDSDWLYEISTNAIGDIFADTRWYFDEEKENDINVFFDPMITEFWKLCDEYEEKARISQDENKFRKEMTESLSEALYLPDYSYSSYSYTDTKHKNGCRIVIVLYPEFCHHYLVPGALCEAYEAFEVNTKRIKEALAALEQPEIIELPKKKRQRKKAA